MMTLIRYFDGRLQGAVLLSIAGDAMRVAIPGAHDAAEFRHHSGRWLSEGGDEVEIEFSVAEAGDRACAAPSTWRGLRIA